MTIPLLNLNSDPDLNSDLYQYQYFNLDQYLVPLRRRAPGKAEGQESSVVQSNHTTKLGGPLTQSGVLQALA